MRSSLVSPCASLVRRCNTTCTNGFVLKRSICPYTSVHTTTSTSITHNATPAIATTNSGRAYDKTYHYNLTYRGLHNDTILTFHTPTTTNEHLPMVFPVAYPREIVFLVGAPGAGKGTHSTMVGKQRNFTAPTIVVSDLLDTPACKLLKDSGAMVDDNLVFIALMTELQKPIYKDGVVVDGFPRTAAQVEFVSEFYRAQCNSLLTSSSRILFVALHVDEDVSINRQLERGKQIALLNQQHKALGKPLLDIRLTDTLPSASLTRYQVFETQCKAVQTLSNAFPLVVVDASASKQKVQVELIEKMSHLPFPHVN